MNKNGFTLIELLAVVVVLAIILVVASPKIFNAVEVSKKKAFEISANKLIQEANNLYVSDNINISQNGKEFTIENNAFVGDSIDVSGELPDSGKIYIDQEGGTAILLRKGDYCVYKDFSEKEITISSNYASCVLNIPEVVPDTCFTRTNDGVQVTITDYNNTCSKNVVIPDTLDGLPVKKIGDYAFFRNSLKSIKIPNGIYSVGLFSFYDNLLSNIEIPSSLNTIEPWAFADNLLKKLSIPYGVVTIKYSAFRDNIITDLSISNSVKIIEGGVFNNNQLSDENAFIYSRNVDGSINDTILVSYGGTKKDNVVIPNNVTIIGNAAFSRVNLNSILIPNGVTAIESNAFLENNLANITLPSSILSLGSQSFRHNKITNLVIPVGLKTLSSMSFENNLLTNISLPNTITTIEYSVFNSNFLPDAQAFIYGRNSDGSINNTVLVSYGGAKKDNIVIPSTVTTIPAFSLSSCGIKSITLPPSITVIQGSVFSNNELSNIIIPSGVTSIGPTSFGYNNLINISIPSNVNVTTSSFSQSFYDTYVTNNASAGGTYTATSQTGTWTKQP